MSVGVKLQLSRQWRVYLYLPFVLFFSAPAGKWEQSSTELRYYFQPLRRFMIEHWKQITQMITNSAAHMKFDFYYNLKTSSDPAFTSHKGKLSHESLLHACLDSNWNAMVAFLWVSSLRHIRVCVCWACRAEVLWSGSEPLQCRAAPGTSTGKYY